MDLNMANGTGLILIGLIVERRRAWRRKARRCGVALQAQRVHIVTSKQTRIGRPMRRMTGDAAFGLERGMFIHERTRSFCVALGADSILVGA